MNQSNQVVLKMVLASPVGQALSDADREALKQILETTDAREVQGWLGDQIRKAALMAKGDYVGHPFRGNQFADSSGTSTGGASGTPRFGYGSGARTSSLKEGDYADIDTKNANYVGTILGIKDGVVFFDDEDKGEVKFNLKDVKAIDGDKVDRPQNTVRTESVEDERTRLAEGARAAERAKYENNPEKLKQDAAEARVRGEKEYKERMMRDLTPAGKRMVRSADKSQEGFDRAKEELEILESSRDQLIDDLVNEDGMSKREAQKSIDDEIKVARFAVENSKFNNSEKPEDDSAEAGRERIRAIEAREKEIARATERAKRERASENERRKTLTPVTEDNIDKPLKGDEAKEFKSHFKEAQAAIKTTRALIAQLRERANDKAMRSRLGPKGLDRVQMDLQEAQEETDRFEDILNSNRKASIRSAVSISAMGTDVGETVKGLIRSSALDMKVDIFKIDDAALQTAGDRNFGVSGDKYDVEAAFDQL